MADTTTSKKKIYQFTCHFIPDEETDGFVVEVPALPGCVTQGDTYKEAEKMAQEAIELYCETLIERGLSVPEDEDIEFFKKKIEIPLTLELAH